MTAYLIVFRETSIKDPAGMQEYSQRNRENAAAFHEQFCFHPLVVNGRLEILEGAGPEGVVVVQFPTFEAAKAWYESPAYQEVLPLRTNAAEWRAVIVEGLD